MLRILRGLFSQSGTGLPNYRVGPKYDGSGAAIMVFEPETTFPEYETFASGRCVRAIKVVRPFRPLQQPQVYVGKLAPFAGLGGLQAGQIITQPLQND